MNPGAQLRDLASRGSMRFSRLEKRQQSLILLLAGVLAFSFAYNQFYKPQRHELRRVQRKAESLEHKIKDLQAASDQWRKKLEAQADELNKKHDRRAVFIVPVGDAVVKLRAMVVEGKYPGVKSQSALFRDSIGHAGPHVQALAAYCNFAAIYRVSPKGLKVRIRGIEDAQNALLQKLAWDTVSNYSHSGVASKQR